MEDAMKDRLSAARQDLTCHVHCPTGLETQIEGECILLVKDFARAIIDEWKDWLTGSLPMAGIAVTSLINPDWIHLPLWTWALLIFVGGLLFAMFRVYRQTLSDWL
jgi:hypothetical protein